MDRSRVVRIRRPPSTGDGPPFRFGSGYVVRQGQVLTAAHVLVAADPSLAARRTRHRARRRPLLGRHVGRAQAGDDER